MYARSLILAGVAMLAYAVPAAAQNRSDIIQDGVVNSAHVSQRGNRGNNAQTLQYGFDNYASHSQRGRRNTSGIGQTGVFNGADVHQRRR